MSTRIALIGIIVENPEATEKLNSILHEYSAYIVGRMGVPYRERGVAIISVIVDAENNVISACFVAEYFITRYSNLPNRNNKSPTEIRTVKYCGKEGSIVAVS